MPRLTEVEIAQRDANCAAAVEASQRGDSDALEKAFADEAARKLEQRAHYWAADEFVRSAWKRHEGEHVVFKVVRAIASLVLGSSAKLANALLRERVQRVALEQRVIKLAATVAQLSAAPMEYVGTYDTSKTYRRGQFVTDRGSCWFCRAATTSARPGGNSDWQLAVRKGDDARDLR